MLPAVDFREVFFNANDAILIADLDSGLIIDANWRMCELLRRKPEEVVGIHHDEIFAKGGAAKALPEDSGIPCRHGVGKNTLLRGDGSFCPVEFSTSLSNVRERLLVTCIMREIAGYRQAAARLASTHALLHAIGDLQSQFIGAAPMSTLLKEILEKFVALTGSEYGFLGESLQTSDGMPYFKIQAMSDSVWNSVTRDFHARNAPIGLEFYRLDNIFGAILQADGPLIANDYPAAAGRPGLPEGHPPVRSFLGLPFSNGGETLGCIGLANRAQGYDAELVDFLKPLLAICGSLVGANRANQWRQGAESELRRQAQVFDNISDAVILTDRDGIILDCNPAAVSMLGASRKRLLGAPLGFMLPPDEDASDPTRRAIAAVEKDGCWSGILAVRREDGGRGVWDTSVLPLRDDGGDSGDGSVLVWFNHDITERRAAQAKLAERTLELNTIADLSPDGFVFVDHHNRVTYVNPAFEQMTGLSREAVRGIGLAAFNEAMASLCDAASAAAQRQDGESALLQLMRPRLAILKRTLRTLRDEAGTLRGTVQYYRDVSQETEVDRMKSEFLSTAAHELRTPMASVFGFSELLLRRNFDAGKQREFLEIIHRQAGQLVSLVNELLDLARIEARAGKDFKIGEHDLAPIIHESLAELFLPGERQRVNAAVPDYLPPVLADRDKLLLALGNVLGNAAKYSMGRGRIDIEIRQRQAADGRQVGIVVRDQGIGMTAEQVSRICERFYRADTSGKIPGTGLGMSIVKEVIGIFKGAVDVASCPGEGTEVTLWLPAAPGMAYMAGNA